MNVVVLQCDFTQKFYSVFIGKIGTCVKCDDKWKVVNFNINDENNVDIHLPAHCIEKCRKPKSVFDKKSIYRMEGEVGPDVPWGRILIKVTLYSAVTVVSATGWYKRFRNQVGFVLELEKDSAKVYFDAEDIGLIQMPMCSLDPASMGDLMKQVDGEVFLDRRVIVSVGKYFAHTGKVTKVKSGWVELFLDEKQEKIAKRGDSVILYDIVASFVDNEGGNTSPHTNLSIADGIANGKIDDTSNLEGRRPKRVASTTTYGMSWVDKKVMLPSGQLGIVIKADRSSCTVELADNSGAVIMALKSELQVCPEKLKVSPRARALDEKAGFFPTPIHGDTFKEHVKRYVTKQMEALKRRPNLKEWKIKIDTDCIENGVCERSNDASIPTLFHFSSCAMCGVEKEGEQDTCWNNRCSLSPVYDKSLGTADAPIHETPLPNERILHAITAPVKSILPDRKRRYTSVSPRKFVQDHSMDGYTYRWTKRANHSYLSHPAPLPTWKSKQVSPTKCPSLVQPSIIKPSILSSSPMKTKEEDHSSSKYSVSSMDQS